MSVDDADGEKKQGATISTMLPVGEMPPDEDRDPNSLYLLPFDTRVRDHALGHYLGVWSDLERAFGSLVRLFLGVDFATSGVIVANLQGNGQMRELVSALGELKCNEEEFSELTRLCNRFKKQATNRNKIMHGHWEPHIAVGADDQNRPYVAEVDWQRNYDPKSPAAQVMQRQTPVGEGHPNKYDIDKIRECAKNAQQLAKDIGDFAASTGKRIRPFGLPN